MKRKNTCQHDDIEAVLKGREIICNDCDASWVAVTANLCTTLSANKVWKSEDWWRDNNDESEDKKRMCDWCAANVSEWHDFTDIIVCGDCADARHDSGWEFFCEDCFLDNCENCNKEIVSCGDRGQDMNSACSICVKSTADDLRDLDSW